MTDGAVTEQATPAESGALTPEVTRAILERLDGKDTIEEIIDALLGGYIERAEPPPPPPVKPQPLTEEERAALKRLPEVYGKVTPAVRRALTPKEMDSLIEEAVTINAILDPLTRRKSDSIRETIAHHFDVIAEEEAVRALGPDAADEEKADVIAGIPRDGKGHYAVKQDHQAEHGNAQRFPTGGKPALSSSEIERLYREGVIDRKTWMAITVKPALAPPSRHIDSSRLREAVKRNPSLLFKLAGVTKEVLPGTTVKVSK